MFTHATMTSSRFAAKWRDVELKERCSSQKQFIDRCHLLEVRTRIDDSLSGTGNQLRDRTLAKIYNQRPTWLDNTHKKLDRAVLHAYGWDDLIPALVDGEDPVTRNPSPVPSPEEELLARLLALDLERAGTETT